MTENDRAEDIDHYLQQSIQELKRVEHLVYVSLKYTRTVDVLLNIINRMIDGYEEMWNAYLAALVHEGKIPSIPTQPVVRAQIIKDNYDDEEILENVNIYILMRKLHRSNPEREQEFRRHVAMRTIIEGREEIVNIDIITQHHHTQKEFLTWSYHRLLPDEVEALKNRNK